MNKRFKLRDLTVDRIALARQGINQHAHILVAKADEDCEDEKDDEKNPFASMKKKKDAKKMMEKSVNDILASITTGLVDAEVLKDSATTEDFRDILPTETLNSLETVIKSVLNAASTGEQMSIQEHMDNLPEEVVDYVADLETQVASLTKSLEEAQKPAEEEVDPIAKAVAELPEEAKAILKANEARLLKAEADLEAFRVEKATAEWVAKARALDGAIEDPEAFGTTLREIADLKPELADAVEKALKTASDRVAAGNLFKEVGHTGAGPSDTESRVAAIAKALRDADPKLSQAAALAKAWTDNPDLYDQHTAEMRNR